MDPLDFEYYTPPFRLQEFDKVIDTIDKGVYQTTQKALQVYEYVGKTIGQLVDAKQAAYGDSFGKAPLILRILYPTGIAPEQYEDVLAMVRILDKFSRIATDKGALGENPWQDVAGYGLLMNKEGQ
jgi:hypothetical protein